MPMFSNSCESVVKYLGSKRAVDRASGVTLSSPMAAAPLYNAGAIDKRSHKPAGGSQRTLYWLTTAGLAMLKGFGGQRCRECACTEFNACRIGHASETCRWVEQNLCSAPPCLKRAGYKLMNGLHGNLVWYTPNGRPADLPIITEAEARRRGGKRVAAGRRP